MRLPIINDPKYGPCIFIDNSTLELMTTCPRALEYNFIEERVGSGEKAALNFGGAVHLALEYRYKTYGAEAPDLYYEADVLPLLEKFFNEHPTPVDDYRNLNWCLEVLRHYNIIYQREVFDIFVDSNDKVIVEQSFAVPLCKIDDVTIIYIGRIDLPTKWDDGTFIKDHKTTSMLGDLFWTKQRMSAQPKGYCWAWQRTTGETPKGYVINAIRVKEPAKKADPDQWWRESMARQRFILQPGELDEWQQNCSALCEEMLWYAKRDYFPMKTAWCSIYSKCQYIEVCSLAKVDRGTMLASGFFTKNTWSPLTKK